jgi:hypothetical protein
VRGAPVYLLNGGGFEPRPVGPEDRARVAAQVRRSIAAMRERLKDPATNTAERASFAPSPGAACRSCNFRGVCSFAR